MAEQKKARSSNYLALFCRANRHRGTGKSISLAIPHFDEHETTIVQHNQVDLTETATAVFFKEPQTLAKQIIQGQLLGSSAY